ncbi:MAG: DUF2809 domain-containing protein [Planctomycetaceae bacterium]
MSDSPADTQGTSVVRHRWKACALIPVVIVIGLGCKRYSGPGSDWVNNWGPASVAYEWMLMLLAFVIIPRRTAIVRIAVGVFMVTCLIEFLQLWKPEWLQTIRATVPGRLILGTTFSWWDFPAYLVGCLTGIFLLRSVAK